MFVLLMHFILWIHAFKLSITFLLISSLNQLPLHSDWVFTIQHLFRLHQKVITTCRLQWASSFQTAITTNVCDIHKGVVTRLNIFIVFEWRNVELYIFLSRILFLYCWYISYYKYMHLSSALHFSSFPRTTSFFFIPTEFS